jgi:hypothetical protein
MTLLTTLALGATLEVPDDHSTVQAAVNAAAPGDTIVIASGDRNGDITIAKDLTLVGAGMNDTVLQGGDGLELLRVESGAEVEVRSLTLRADDTDGAVSVTGTSILHLVDVKLRGASPSASVGYAGPYGGGAYVTSSSHLSLTDSIVCDNDGKSGDWNMDGGGLYIDATSTLDAAYSVFAVNEGHKGGAIYSVNGATLQNNTFVGNRAVTGVAVGIGNGSATAVNNLFLFQDDFNLKKGQQPQFVLQQYNAGVVTGSYNLFFGNDEDDSNGVLTNTLSADPTLVDDDRPCADATLYDFTPLSGSPALDGGDPAVDPVVGAYLDADEDGSPATVDCDDGDPASYPGAPELVGDEVDQNCDGAELCFADADGDGAHDPYSTVPSIDTDCDDAGEAEATAPVDCDDTDDTVHPGAGEATADGVDQDCDGLERCYVDADDDGHGTTTTVLADLDCADPFVSNLDDDCVDDDPSIHPGAPEVVGDEIDQDCDGDELCYLDADRDDARHPTDTFPSGDLDCNDNDEAPASAPVDCDDTDDEVYPGAVEGVADGIDQDCSGDELCHADTDLDGYGGDAAVVPGPLDCDDPGTSATDDDCDDTDVNQFPGAPEQCNEADDDCDGVVDNDIQFVYWHRDADGDGYGEASTGILECIAPEGYVSNADDCDDGRAAVNPGVDEVPCNGLDDDCEPLTPDDDGSCDTGTVDTGAPTTPGGTDTGTPTVSTVPPTDSTPTVPTQTDGTAQAVTAAPAGKGCGCSTPSSSLSWGGLWVALGLGWSRRRRPRGI